MNRSVEQVEAGPDWPSLIRRLAEARGTGQDGLVRVALAAARELADADGAAVLHWVGGRARPVASKGEVVDIRWRRLADRAAVVDGRPVATACAGNGQSLLVVRTPGRPPFHPGVLKVLKALALLLHWAAVEPRTALAALYEVARKVIGSMDLEEVLLTVANAASSLMRAEIAGVLLLDTDTGELEMRCAVGHRTVGTARLRVRPGQGLAGKALETGRPERVDEYATDPSISKDFLSIAQEEGTRSALCAPLQVKGRTEGVLCVWRRRHSVFTDDDVRLMEALADLAAVAVERAALYQAQERSTAELARAHEELERRYRAARRALEIHDELTQVAVEGSDVEEALRRLHELTGGRTVLVGDDLAPMAEVPPGVSAQVLRHLPAELRRPPGSGPRSRVMTPRRGEWFVAAPVRATGVGFGHLCVLLEREPSPEDVAAVEQASTVCALLLARQEAALAGLRRLQSEFVWDLLEGRIPDDAQAVLKVRHLGQSLELPLRVLLVRADGVERLAGLGDSAQDLDRYRGRVGQAVADALAGVSGLRPVVARRGDNFAILVSVPEGHRPEVAREWADAAIRAPCPPGVRLRAGVSGVARAVRDLPAAFRQAQFALAASDPEERRAVVFEDLGVLQFLLSPAGREDLERFADQVLGPLLRYDRTRGGVLVRTLEAYLRADCNLQRAARLLFVHHKTVRYRLQRIQELAGLDLSREEDRFNAHLAVRIVRLTEPGAFA